GRYVTYLSTALSSATWTGVWNTAVLVVRDMTLFTNTLVSSKPYILYQDAGIAYPPPVGQASPISADGRFVVLKSQDQSLTAVPFSVPQIFVWDRQFGVSLASVNGLVGGAASLECFNPALSGNGLWSAWDTAANNLIPVDNNGASDVFVHGPGGS
ncbi:MAG TPA: hypothetical protein VKU80_10850, partial [Planctomycetota bacterium]|nr:hypothetical protein [Planctomycetota bacterium]